MEAAAPESPSLETMLARSAALDATAVRLHREISAAVDTDVAAVTRLTRALRETYRERERVRAAIAEQRAL